ncbi:hypothetical protein C8A01DRAFT_14922 [Parachaetomium inaequale]|uniref:Uncharacterized protein n=1 Tax=Parachaetomium inaequale TaxID=2588326 RepID=A0AAN6PI47_9PEZI|nr:hypothetical protein C8A01DRAFT_14922 [Parachaetomium inaequale]
MEHHFDNCPHRDPTWSKTARDESDFNFLVRNRGSMPPIRSVVSWPELAAHLDRASRDGYPATKAFVLAHFHANKRKFGRFPTTHPRPMPFLEDPWTLTIDNVRKHLADLLETEVYVPLPRADRADVREKAAPNEGSKADGDDTIMGDDGDDDDLEDDLGALGKALDSIISNDPAEVPLPPQHQAEVDDLDREDEIDYDDSD